MSTKALFSKRSRSGKPSVIFGRKAKEIRKLKTECMLAIEKMKAVLQAKVNEIEASCAHNFQNISGHMCQESCCPNIFFAGGESARSRGVGNVDFVVTCSECGQMKVMNVRQSCPICLGPMSEPEKDINRETYYGEKYMYYAAMVVRCGKCNIGFVWDVWDK